MILKVRQRDARWYENWMRWFAWFPVRLSDSTLVWLETVERKDSQPLDDSIVWQYQRVARARNWQGTSG